MKKFTAAILAVIMMFAFAAFTVSAEELPTPTFYYDLVDKKPNGNFEKFTTRLSERGNAILKAVDGDEETSRLMVFTDDNIKLSDVQYVVIKFKHLRTEVQSYPGEFNLVGKDGSGEKKAEVTYNSSENYQTIVLDLSNTFDGDVHYFTLMWHKAARFECEVEIEYIAAFKTKADADNYAANFDRHAQPSGDDSSSDNGETPDTGDTAAVAAIILAVSTAVVIPVVVNSKKRK